MRTTVVVDTEPAACPVPGCGGRLEARHIAIRPDAPVAGAVVLEGWAAVCIGLLGEPDPIGAARLSGRGQPCGFSVALHPRRV